MEVSPTDSIGGVLQATVFQVCQQIIPYSKELVVSGVVTIEADGKEFCSLKIKQATDKERPPSRLQLISQALDKDITSIASNEKEVKKPGRPTSRVGRPPSRQCARPPSRQRESAEPAKDEPKRSSSRLAARIKSSPESEKTGLPKPNLGPSKNLSGSQSSLVNTLVAEAMKLWYDEGSSPDRLLEMKKDSDPQRSAAAELGLEAVRQWGQISPETLEAAAQLRRLGEQAAALAAINQIPQQAVNVSTAKTDKPPLPKPDIQFNEPAKNVRPRRKKKTKDLDADIPDTPVVPQKGIQPKRHRFQSEGRDVPSKNSKGMYECPACGKEFTFSTNLTRHQRNFHGRPYTRKTKDMKQGPDQNWLTKAVTETAAEAEAPKARTESKGCFVCAICFAKFDTEKQMDEHQNTAHSDNSLDEDSLTCNKDSSSVSPAESTSSRPRRSPRNSAIASREKRPSPKSDLGKKGRKKKKADLIVIDVDGDQSPTPSDASSRKGSPPEGDIKTDGGVEGNSGKYSCSYCGRNFPLYRNLGRHLKSTHGVSVVDIEMQGSIANKDSAQKGQHTCTICGSSFTFSANLSRHMSKVHQIVPQKETFTKGDDKSDKEDAFKENEPSNVPSVQKKEDRYVCDICGARFTFSANLSRHMKRTHKMIRKVADTSPIIIPDENEAPGGGIQGDISPVPSLQDATGATADPDNVPVLKNEFHAATTSQTTGHEETVFVGDITVVNVPSTAEASTGTQMMVTQPQSFFRPISFGMQSTPIGSSALPVVPTTKTSPSTDKEVADALCSKVSKKQFNCSVCSQVFGFQANLVRHMKAMHGFADDQQTPQRKIKHSFTMAPTCQSSLPPIPSGTVPLIVPVPLQPISFSPKAVVTTANQATGTIESLSMSQDNARHRHMCSICGASFTFRTNLTRHMKKQHGQVPPSEIDSIVNTSGQAGSGGESPTCSPPIGESSPPAVEPSTHNVPSLLGTGVPVLPASSSGRTQ